MVLIIKIQAGRDVGSALAILEGLTAIDDA